MLALGALGWNMDKTPITLTKIEVARRQLNEAIILFFQRRDPIIVHALAAAAHEVLRDLCKHRALNCRSMLYDTGLIREDKREAVRAYLREAQNYFKHANRDSEEMLEFRPYNTQFYILDAIEMWRTLGEQPFIAAAVFRIWILLSHPSLFADATMKVEHEKFKAEHDFDITDYDSILRAIID